MAKLPAPKLAFHQRLVLFGWLLSLFGKHTLEELVTHTKLDDPDKQYFNPDGTSGFYHALKPCWDTHHETHPLREAGEGRRLSGGERQEAGEGRRLNGGERQNNGRDRLQAYDENVGRHWNQIRKVHPRGDTLTLTYFQYLALLFTEIVLDRWFADTDSFLAELNEYINKWNIGKDAGSQVLPYEGKDFRFNKLAFWMATGSGKTFLFHVNLLQFKDYWKRYRPHQKIDHIILLTIGEDLSKQHLKDLADSGIDAEVFKRGGNLLSGETVEVLEFSKLKDSSGTVTVSVDALKGNNLVFVDEGHRGSSGDVLMGYRDALVEGSGFCFEYSATFGQAMSGAIKTKPSFVQSYCRAVVMDYSYRYFHGDGYGKDYDILNIATGLEQDQKAKHLYLTGCVLTYYQQRRFYADTEASPEFARYRLETPLWIFVGDTVNAVRKEGGKDTSDIAEILLFLAWFLRDSETASANLNRLLNGTDGLVTTGTTAASIFANRFDYVRDSKRRGRELWVDICATVFNNPNGGALKVEPKRGDLGELGLCVGEAEHFGMISVGDGDKLKDLLEGHSELVVQVKDITVNLFERIAEKNSPINVLIGAQKFNTGWNSLRVSVMGLLNVGKGEGTEIIQLFGRGVRLMGLDGCLRRSHYVTRTDAPHPEKLPMLETLHIFGLNANYMMKFQDDLARGGVMTDTTQKMVEVRFPPIIAPLPTNPYLKNLRLKDGVNFLKDGPIVALTKEIPERLIKLPLSLDWYARVGRNAGTENAAIANLGGAQETTLKKQHIAWLDIPLLLRDLEDYKRLKNYHKLLLSTKAITYLLTERNDWYKLTCPPQVLEFTDLTCISEWQRIAYALLCKHLDRLWGVYRDEYEKTRFETRNLDETDPNFQFTYELIIKPEQTDAVSVAKTIADKVAEGKPTQIAANGWQAQVFNKHLYWPLLHYPGAGASIKPATVALNADELEFLSDLHTYIEKEKNGFLKDKQLYLLRNRTRDGGIGFFSSDNFHPDFILWILDQSTQYVTFLDPKGIRNLEGGLNGPKARLFEYLSDTLSAELKDPTLILNSFLISNTKKRELEWLPKNAPDTLFTEAHVLLQKDNADTYISELMHAILESKNKT
ncbi:DEAD/DEAH box helicase family protein [Armatimonas sp.]|uniref:DEAD/DEAH box helicase family protein n=1 Tax=Armatimonas sp. TaxID=1872638 RepID=UPI00286CCE89|nr:DEAD/DEAH box helicase family protein [Armatimonas sp.]